MTKKQRRLEQQLRNQLIQEGSADAFSAAYDQFHNHVLEHGMWGKPTFGRLHWQTSLYQYDADDVAGNPYWNPLPSELSNRIREGHWRR